MIYDVIRQLFYSTVPLRLFIGYVSEWSNILVKNIIIFYSHFVCIRILQIAYFNYCEPTVKVFNGVRWWVSQYIGWHSVGRQMVRKFNRNEYSNAAEICFMCRTTPHLQASTTIFIISHCKKNSPRYCYKCTYGLNVKYLSFLSDFNVTWIILRLILEKYSIVRFHKNPSSGSGIVLCGQIDRKTDRHDEARSRFSQFRERA